jgi:hypothetical protein
VTCHFMSMPWTYGLALWTRFIVPSTYYMQFLIGKSKSFSSRISWRLEFCKNTPKLFCNLDLVPVIFHIGPYLTFYYYN